MGVGGLAGGYRPEVWGPPMAYTTPEGTAVNFDFISAWNSLLFKFTSPGYSPLSGSSILFNFISAWNALIFEFAPEVPPPITKELLRLLGVRLRGQVYKYWICWVWRGHQRIRRYSIGANPRTASQQANRSKFAQANAAALSLDIDGRVYWGKIGVRKKEPLPWQQAFIQAYMKDLVNLSTMRHVRKLGTR